MDLQIDSTGFCETELNDDDLVQLLSWLVDVDTCIRQTWQTCLTKMDATRLERVTQMLSSTSAVKSSFVLCSVIDFHLEWKELITQEDANGESAFSRLLKDRNSEGIELLFNAGLRQSDFTAMNWVYLLSIEKQLGSKELKRFGARGLVEMAMAV